MNRSSQFQSLALQEWSHYGITNIRIQTQMQQAGDEHWVAAQKAQQFQQQTMELSDY
jgi:hypothetical protein